MIKKGSESNRALRKKLNNDVTNILLLFEKVQEWADLSNILQKLYLTIEKYEVFLDISSKFLLFRRLSQCLNPMLPSGVHSKALIIYGSIFKKVEKTYFMDNIHILCSGIFEFMLHCTISLKTIYFKNIKSILNLRENIHMFTYALLLSLFNVVDSDNNILLYIYSINNYIGENIFFNNLWLLLLRHSEIRTNVLNFLETSFSPQIYLLSKERIRTLLPYKDELVLSSLIFSLNDKNILNQRITLSLLINNFPLYDVQVDLSLSQNLNNASRVGFNKGGQIINKNNITSYNDNLRQNVSNIRIKDGNINVKRNICSQFSESFSTSHFNNNNNDKIQKNTSFENGKKKENIINNEFPKRGIFNINEIDKNEKEYINTKIVNGKSYKKNLNKTYCEENKYDSPNSILFNEISKKIIIRNVMFLLHKSDMGLNRRIFKYLYMYENNDDKHIKDNINLESYKIYYETIIDILENKFNDNPIDILEVLFILFKNTDYININKYIMEKIFLYLLKFFYKNRDNSNINEYFKKILNIELISFETITNIFMCTFHYLKNDEELFKNNINAYIKKFINLLNIMTYFLEYIQEINKKFYFYFVFVFSTTLLIFVNFLNNKLINMIQNHLSMNLFNDYHQFLNFIRLIPGKDAALCYFHFFVIKYNNFYLQKTLFLIITGILFKEMAIHDIGVVNCFANELSNENNQNFENNFNYRYNVDKSNNIIQSSYENCRSDIDKNSKHELSNSMINIKNNAENFDNIKEMKRNNPNCELNVKNQNSKIEKSFEWDEKLKYVFKKYISKLKYNLIDAIIKNKEFHFFTNNYEYIIFLFFNYHILIEKDKINDSCSFFLINILKNCNKENTNKFYFWAYLFLNIIRINFNKIVLLNYREIKTEEKKTSQNSTNSNQSNNISIPTNNNNPNQIKGKNKQVNKAYSNDKNNGQIEREISFNYDKNYEDDNFIINQIEKNKERKFSINELDNIKEYMIYDSFKNNEMKNLFDDLIKYNGRNGSSSIYFSSFRNYFSNVKSGVLFNRNFVANILIYSNKLVKYIFNYIKILKHNKCFIKLFFDINYMYNFCHNHYCLNILRQSLKTKDSDKLMHNTKIILEYIINNKISDFHIIHSNFYNLTHNLFKLYQKRNILINFYIAKFLKSNKKNIPYIFDHIIISMFELITCIEQIFDKEEVENSKMAIYKNRDDNNEPMDKYDIKNKNISRCSFVNNDHIFGNEYENRNQTDYRNEKIGYQNNFYYSNIENREKFDKESIPNKIKNRQNIPCDIRKNYEIVLNKLKCRFDYLNFFFCNIENFMLWLYQHKISKNIYNYREKIILKNYEENINIIVCCICTEGNISSLYFRNYLDVFFILFLKILYINERIQDVNNLDSNINLKSNKTNEHNEINYYSDNNKLNKKQKKNNKILFKQNKLLEFKRDVIELINKIFNLNENKHFEYNKILYIYYKETIHHFLFLFYYFTIKKYYILQIQLIRFIRYVLFRYENNGEKLVIYGFLPSILTTGIGNKIVLKDEDKESIKMKENKLSTKYTNYDEFIIASNNYFDIINANNEKIKNDVFIFSVLRKSMTIILNTNEKVIYKEVLKSIIYLIENIITERSVKTYYLTVFFLDLLYIIKIEDKKKKKNIFFIKKFCQFLLEIFKLIYKDELLSENKNEIKQEYKYDYNSISIEEIENSLMENKVPIQPFCVIFSIKTDDKYLNMQHINISTLFSVIFNLYVFLKKRLNYYYKNDKDLINCDENKNISINNNSSIYNYNNSSIYNYNNSSIYNYNNSSIYNEVNSEHNNPENYNKDLNHNIFDRDESMDKGNDNSVFTFSYDIDPKKYKSNFQNNKVYQTNDLMNDALKEENLQYNSMEKENINYDKINNNVKENKFFDKHDDANFDKNIIYNNNTNKEINIIYDDNSVNNFKIKKKLYEYDNMEYTSWKGKHNEYNYENNKNYEQNEEDTYKTRNNDKRIDDCYYKEEKEIQSYYDKKNTSGNFLINEYDLSVNDNPKQVQGNKVDLIYERKHSNSYQFCEKNIFNASQNGVDNENSYTDKNYLIKSVHYNSDWNNNKMLGDRDGNRNCNNLSKYNNGYISSLKKKNKKISLLKVCLINIISISKITYFITRNEFLFISNLYSLFKRNIPNYKSDNGNDNGNDNVNDNDAGGVDKEYDVVNIQDDDCEKKKYKTKIEASKYSGSEQSSIDGNGTFDEDDIVKRDKNMLKKLKNMKKHGKKENKIFLKKLNKKKKKKHIYENKKLSLFLLLLTEFNEDILVKILEDIVNYYEKYKNKININTFMYFLFNIYLNICQLSQKIINCFVDILFLLIKKITLNSQNVMSSIWFLYILFIIEKNHAYLFNDKLQKKIIIEQINIVIQISLYSYYAKNIKNNYNIQLPLPSFVYPFNIYYIKNNSNLDINKYFRKKNETSKFINLNDNDEIKKIIHNYSSKSIESHFNINDYSEIAAINSLAFLLMCFYHAVNVKNAEESQNEFDNNLHNKNEVKKNNGNNTIGNNNNNTNNNNNNNNNLVSISNNTHSGANRQINSGNNNLNNINHNYYNNNLINGYSNNNNFVGIGVKSFITESAINLFYENFGKYISLLYNNNIQNVFYRYPFFLIINFLLDYNYNCRYYIKKIISDLYYCISNLDIRCTQALSNIFKKINEANIDDLLLPPTSSIFSLKFNIINSRINYINKLSLIILSGSWNFYLNYLPKIAENISEYLKYCTDLKLYREILILICSIIIRNDENEIYIIIPTFISLILQIYHVERIKYKIAIENLKNVDKNDDNYIYDFNTYDNSDVLCLLRTLLIIINILVKRNVNFINFYSWIFFKDISIKKNTFSTHKDMGNYITPAVYNKAINNMIKNHISIQNSHNIIEPDTSSSEYNINKSVETNGITTINYTKEGVVIVDESIPNANSPQIEKDIKPDIDISKKNEMPKNSMKQKKKNNMITIFLNYTEEKIYNYHLMANNKKIKNNNNTNNNSINITSNVNNNIGSNIPSMLSSQYTMKKNLITNKNKNDESKFVAFLDIIEQVYGHHSSAKRPSQDDSINEEGNNENSQIVTNKDENNLSNSDYTEDNDSIEMGHALTSSSDNSNTSCSGYKEKYKQNDDNEKSINIDEPFDTQNLYYNNEIKNKSYCDHYLNEYIDDEKYKSINDETSSNYNLSTSSGNSTSSIFSNPLIKNNTILPDTSGDEIINNNINLDNTNAMESALDIENIDKDSNSDIYNHPTKNWNNAKCLTNYDIHDILKHTKKKKKKISIHSNTNIPFVLVYLAKKIKINFYKYSMKKSKDETLILLKELNPVENDINDLFLEVNLNAIYSDLLIN
ncbi:conserved Plasmodium protein, unknown function [Plasmodium berghei]|uniref:DOP1 N-terminal domain-containing protein n=2 Tax=Plasmodium berghei TaxID=5821 RepID=A0A509AKI3_PLABA|nr:conserved Plasmodium protein, unknown function [Plasmodium berghei ANKA]SCL91620.1 conserved Plasmodium protein, unknown function [Plasmodium berghei]SCM15499.1 conserved Plasmodium protein, unknown function [Plasmodium berghei]SCM17291.1 conserved Plasmodium protein, unknown function [Plasmodium berghei]SCN22468.1 conserved Plasmodium protein, unknown function [Plasmodium berghei]VUC54264.1 conserved Plasmodium protein, unknown function [Plasmodium berghei ANKA]|eukprot:XP_034420097.1 conserved Plasmodium protein, unknown function [Plasmodium berghei ANKA]